MRHPLGPAAAVSLALAAAGLWLWLPAASPKAALKATLGTAAATGAPAPGAPGPGGSVAAPSAQDVTPVCGDPHPSSSLGPAPSLPSQPVQVLAGTFPVQGFSVTPSAIYVFDGKDLRIFSLAGKPEGAFELPEQFRSPSQVTGPFVDPSGDIWLDSYYGDRLDKFSPSGRLLWSSRAWANSSIFDLSTPDGFRLGVTVYTGHGQERTEVLGENGRRIGALPLALDGSVTPAPGGRWLVSNAGYVRVYSVSWHLISSFGDPQVPAPSYAGAPYGFSDPGTAFQATTGGPIYTLDAPNTIEETTNRGFLEATTTLGGHLALASGSAYLVKGTLYFAGGPPYSSGQNISALPLSTLQSYLAAAGPVGSLGWGAGVTSGSPSHRVPGNYFPDGTTPQFYASFVPYWARQSAHLTLAYSIWSASDMARGTYPPAKSVPLPSSPKALSHLPLTVPAADRLPGPYELQANLWYTARSPHVLLGSTCVPYAVGAPGDGLDFSSLPPGLGFGGPTDPRGVVLNSQLGLDGFRGEPVGWSTFLPHCNASTPTQVSCGPAAMTFAHAPQSYFQAAYLAQQDHVTYWVQVSTGDALSAALVKEGLWGADVQAVVSYYSQVSNCKVPAGQCAPVSAWEAWNEANNTYSPDGARFARYVLEPFYKAVKSADPQATVIGGSSLGVDLRWWRQVVSAGGLAYMDVAGVHPYTGNNDSWPEDGTISQVSQLAALLKGKPIWFTEVGWWSNGPYNFLHQASTVAEAMVWMKVLGVPVWDYFFDEGGWGNDGVSFSLVEAESVDDYVKPAALAVMEAAQQLAGRAYLGSPDLPVPLAYEALFGPAPGSTSNLAALWTQGLDIAVQVSVSGPQGSSLDVSVANQWGDSRTYQLRSGEHYALALSGQVSYVSYPEANKLSVQAIEPFGQDLALASAGAVATASSSQRPGSSSLQPCCAARDAISGNLVGGWEPAGDDASPTITVKLEHPARVDRVLVVGHSLGSLVGDPRDFTVEVEGQAGKWSEVGQVSGSFYQRATLVQFPPLWAKAVRVSVQVANYGGYAGGGVPLFWPASQPLTMELHAVDIYAAQPSTAPLELGSDIPYTATTTTTPAAQ